MCFAYSCSLFVLINTTVSFPSFSWASCASDTSVGECGYQLDEYYQVESKKSSLKTDLKTLAINVFFAAVSNVNCGVPCFEGLLSQYIILMAASLLGRAIWRSNLKTRCAKNSQGV